MVENGKIKIQIRRGVRFTNLPKKAIVKLKNDLTFKNQKYENALRHGSYISSSIPEHIKYYAMSTDEKVIWTPRGYIWIMKRWLKDNGYDVELTDKTLLLPEVNFKFYGKLRDYQEIAVRDVVRRYPIGVLEANTGAGKTVTATAIITKRKQPTLVIVHTKELLYQWQDAIKKFLHYDCGLIGDGKFEVKDITVGIINTVKNKIDILKEKFGHIIIDEVHKVAANTFSDTLMEFSAKHYLGLSATTFRNDGLSGAIFVHMGPKVHTVNKKMLRETGKVLQPQIILVKTNFRAARSFIEEEQLPYSTLIKKLTEDQSRNELIVRTIHKDLKKHNEHILVVSDRVTHLKRLSELLNSIRIKNSVLSGKTPVKERTKIVEEARKGNCKVLLASISLISEGFDLENLTALFLTTPVSAKGRVIQAIGRIRRPDKNNPNKIPRVIDVRDDNVKVLRNSGFKRNKIYREEIDL
jgi:superfamily II DNA or RNA helicase